MICRTAPRSFLAAVLILLSVTALSAQEDYEYRPFSLAFVPGITTSLPNPGRIRTTFSFNLVGGYLGRVEGVELGGVFNIEKDRVIGYQAAGAFNFVGGDFTGLQQAGGANIVWGNMNIVQLAGGVNLVRKNANGAQFAPVNIAGTMNGAQFGSVNLAGTLNGAQFSTVNIAREMNGAQFGTVNIAARARGFAGGTVNIAGRHEGFQLGTVNIAHRAKGFQLGVVNIADKLEGDALGVVSIIGNGPHHICLYTEETAKLNAGLKLGSEHIYNVFVAGLEPAGDSTFWYTGLGLGGHIPLGSGRFFVDVDGVAYQPRRSPFWEYEVFSTFTKLRAMGGWKILPGLSIVAGPTLALQITDQASKLIPYNGVRLIDQRLGDGNGVWIRSWPGFTAGIQLF